MVLCSHQSFRILCSSTALAKARRSYHLHVRHVYVLRSGKLPISKREIWVVECIRHLLAKLISPLFHLLPKLLPRIGWLLKIIIDCFNLGTCSFSSIPVIRYFLALINANEYNLAALILKHRGIVMKISSKFLPVSVSRLSLFGKNLILGCMKGDVRHTYYYIVELIYYDI